ncbi:hypothetical protein IWX49DRAFT_179448 [Phyllosticta citricarpa]
MLEVEAAADCWPGNGRGRCGFYRCGGEDNIKAGKGLCLVQLIVRHPYFGSLLRTVEGPTVTSVLVVSVVTEDVMLKQEQILDLILAVSVASATPKATRTGSGKVVMFGAEVFGPFKVRVAVVVGGLAVVELTTVVFAVESEILSHPEQNAVACGPNAESDLNHASLHVAEDVLANESVEIVGVPGVIKSVADVVDVAGAVVESVAAVEVVIESIGVMVEKETCGCAATGDAKELTAKRRKTFLRNSMMRAHHGIEQFTPLETFHPKTILRPMIGGTVPISSSCTMILSRSRWYCGQRRIQRGILQLTFTSLSLSFCGP